MRTHVLPITFHFPQFRSNAGFVAFNLTAFSALQFIYLTVGWRFEDEGGADTSVGVVAAADTRPT